MCSTVIYNNIEIYNKNIKIKTKQLKVFNFFKMNPKLLHRNQDNCVFSCDIFTATELKRSFETKRVLYALVNVVQTLRRNDI